MIYTGNRRVQIWISAEVVGSQPPKVHRFFLEILLKYLKLSPRKTGTPQNLVDMLLCREMMSECNAQPRWMLCAEGPGQRPPKYDRRFCEKLAVTSALPLTVLECPYKNFASDRTFSIYRPLSDGGESMRIYAPYLRIGAPNLEKCGARYKQRVRNFSPFFGLCTPFLKYYLHAKFWTVVLPPPEIGRMAKNGSAAMRILDRTLAKLQSCRHTAVQLLLISGVSYFTCCIAARTLATLAT